MRNKLDKYYEKVNNGDFFKIPKRVKLKNPELCIEAVKKAPGDIQYIPEKFLKEHPEIALEAVQKWGGSIVHIPEDILHEHPEICIEAVKQDGSVISHVPKDLQLSNPQICVEALKENVLVYQHNKFFGKDLREVQEFMLEDVDRLKKVKEKATFSLSPNYNEETMDIYYHLMIQTIGIDEVEKMIQVPTLSTEQIREHNIEFDKKVNELFKKTYTLRGDMAASVDIFNAINLDVYKTKGKNIKFEVYKNINEILESNEVGSISQEELLREAIKRSGLEVDEEVVEKFNSKGKAIVKRLVDERCDLIGKDINSSINEHFATQRAPIERILMAKIKENMISNEGRIDREEILQSIRDELKRTNENGQSFYSPHILEQEDKILDFANLSIEKIYEQNGHLSKSIVEVLKEDKEKIGQGWIRKIQSIPKEFGEEKLMTVATIFKGLDKEDYDVRMEPREGIDEKEAFAILKENSIQGFVTLEQVEQMFGGVHKPYSQEFKKYFKQHREEILSNPEVYFRFSQMQNRFDSIIQESEVIDRYKRGDLSVENLLQIVSKNKYRNVKEGNERLAEVSSKAGLESEYFDAAQEVFEVTKKREGSSIPQVQSSIGKYRGRMLRADDPLNLVVGNITNCCQRLGNVGEGSMMHAATEKNGAIFIVEELDENGKVIRPVAQSWTWRNNGRICYDNIEIREEALQHLDENSQKEIMDIYIEAGKRAIEADEKAMTKLLEEGKITQEVYDEAVLKEVTCGSGYNDLEELTRRLKGGKLKKSDTKTLPKESEKVYAGFAKNKPWIDSKDTQIMLASMDKEKRVQIEKRRMLREHKDENIEVPLEYKNAREVETYKGEDILPTEIRGIKSIEETTFRKEQQLLAECKDVEDLASTYGLDKDKIEVTMSKDEDWYMIGEENESEYYIADLAMVGGVNSQKNNEKKADVKMATVEVAEKIYSKILEMAEKGKTVRYEATRDTSYINTKKMQEKGLIEILQEEKSKFGNSDIDMNNVVISGNVERLKEELRKVRELHAKLKQAELTKVKRNDEDMQR